MFEFCKLFQIFLKGIRKVLIFHFCLYLIFFPLFSVEVFAGSIYSIQDSARKIYSWIEGEGYKGNTTYVDPISGEVYTAEGNIKEGVIELATAAAISGAFKIGGKVVGKIKNGLNYKTLYRAVEPEEYLDIYKNGKFLPSPYGSEGKYFAVTKKGALLEGNNYLPKVSNIKSNEYKYVKASYPKEELKNVQKIVVDQNVPSYVIPNEKLNLFKNIKEFK